LARSATAWLERLAHRASAVRVWHDRPFRLHDRIEFRRDGPVDLVEDAGFIPEQD